MAVINIAALCLFLIGLPSALAFVSETEGPSVQGSFELSSDKGIMHLIELRAARSLDGNVSGEVTLRDAPSTNIEKSSERPPDESSQPFFFTAKIDCLVIKENKAIMSGAITESSSRTYIGRRVLVVAQDNGGAKDPARKDKLTWGVYRTEQKPLVTFDAERPDDQSTQLSWIASDAERADDEGVSSDKDQVIGCQSFPLSAFSFLNGNLVRGTVLVRP